MKIYDFAVVGCSIAGSFVAYRLAQAGFKVAVFESKAIFSRRVCGEYLCPMGVKVLKDEGLGSLIEGKYLPVVGMNIFTPSGLEVRTRFPARGDCQQMGASVNREVFDNDLMQLAIQAGAKVFRPARVNEVLRSSIGWRVRIDNSDHVQARFLIGADGRRSPLARMLGLYRGTDKKRIAVHTYLHAKSDNERKGEMHLFEDGSYIGINPTSEREINISLVCDASKVKEQGGLRGVFNHYIEASSAIKEHYGLISEKEKLSAVSPITYAAKTIAGERFAFIGDASGFIDPLTGEGMYSALWTAKVLSDEIIRESRHVLFDFRKALTRYSSLKLQHFRQKAFLNRMFQFIIRHASLVELIARYLKRKKIRGDVFIGIIGNIYKPREGIFRLVRT